MLMMNHAASVNEQPGFVAPECRVSGKLRFIVADVVTRLFHRMNSDGLLHPGGKAKTEAFNAHEGVKTSSIRKQFGLGR